jgi:hypothetical protein
LPRARQVLGVAKMHVCAQEIAGEDLLEILPPIDNVSRQMIQLGPSRVTQVDGEELDDENVIIHPTCLTSKVVVLQPDARVSFTVIPDDVAWHSKTL